MMQYILGKKQQMFRLREPESYTEDHFGMVYLQYRVENIQV